jgi:hypothetical protein
LCTVELAGRFVGQDGVLLTEGLCLCSGVDNDLRVDSHAFVFGRFGGNAEGWEVWSKDGDESRSEGPTEGSADGEGAIVGHPVAYKSQTVDRST